MFVEDKKTISLPSHYAPFDTGFDLLGDGSLLAVELPGHAKGQFYQDCYKGLEIRHWQQFPIIDKSMMMAKFDQLNTVNIKKSEAFTFAIEAEKTRNFSSTLRGYTIGLSSGTSGNRGLFIVSQQEQQAWADTILAKALPQSILRRQRIVFFLRARGTSILLSVFPQA